MVFGKICLSSCFLNRWKISESSFTSSINSNDGPERRGSCYRFGAVFPTTRRFYQHILALKDGKRGEKEGNLRHRRNCQKVRKSIKVNLNLSEQCIKQTEITSMPLRWAGISYMPRILHSNSKNRPKLSNSKVRSNISLLG